MQTEVQTINSYSKKVKVQISTEELQPIEKNLLKKYQKSVQIRGFRKGKAPLNLVKQQYGIMIQQDLIEETIQTYYFEALNRADVKQVSPGKITDIKFENIDSGMVFEMEVETEPEFELKKYKGLRVEKDVIEVTDEMVEDTLQQLRERYATIKEVEEARQNHHVYFDLQELDQGGLPIVGHKYENLHVELGSGKFDKEIEEQLIGVKKGEKRVVRSESAPAPNSPDQQPVINHYEIHVKKIEEKEYPELDDEFVKNLDDDSIENLEQLRERIRENIKRDLEYRTERTFTDRLIDELLKENPFELPPTMIENYINNLVENFLKQNRSQRINEEAVRKEYRPLAIHHLRWHFLKKKIMEAENIQVSDEEVVNHIDSLPVDDKEKARLKNDKQQFNNIREDILERKIIDLLKENAEIIEVYPQKNSGIEAISNEEDTTQ